MLWVVLQHAKFNVSTTQTCKIHTYSLERAPTYQIYAYFHLLRGTNDPICSIQMIISTICTHPSIYHALSTTRCKIHKCINNKLSHHVYRPCQLSFHLILRKVVTLTTWAELTLESNYLFWIADTCQALLSKHLSVWYMPIFTCLQPIDDWL